MAETEKPVASRDWHVRARVRILTETICHSHYAARTFLPGEEVEMVQWGRAGSPVERDAWWTDFDIDGAYIIDADRVAIIEVLGEVSPESEE